MSMEFLYIGFILKSSIWISPARDPISSTYISCSSRLRPWSDLFWKYRVVQKLIEFLFQIWVLNATMKEICRTMYYVIFKYNNINDTNKMSKNQIITAKFFLKFSKHIETFFACCQVSVFPSFFQTQSGPTQRCHKNFPTITLHK